jgi:hypothetical protein
VALAKVAGAIKDGLLAFSATGLVVMFQMMQAELTERIGEKHARTGAGERTGNWHGTTEGTRPLSRSGTSAFSRLGGGDDHDLA